MSNDQTERAGITSIQALIVRDLGWFCKEPVRPDYGIDLYIECADGDGRPDGRMLAAQVKAGASYFAEGNGEFVTFRGDKRHRDYWLGHSLPVIVVLYDPTSDRAIWQHVTEQNAESTNGGWKLAVPKTQQLGKAAAGALREIARGGMFTLRLNALRADLTWMQMLDDGAQVFVEAVEWLHKSSGRCDLTIIAVRQLGDEEIRRQWTVYAGNTAYEDLFSILFPWADAAIDEDTYEWHDEAHWQEECGAWDSETQTYLLYSETFAEWRDRFPEGLRPYEVGDEVARWRVELTLNELGKGFVTTHAFLSEGQAPDEYEPPRVA